MVSSCSALGCKQRAVKGSRLTFHRFPKNPDLRDKWTKALKRKNFEPTNNSRVCERHFTSEAYNYSASKKTLNWDAVPEIFDFSGFVKDDRIKIQKTSDSERIQSVQFVDVDSLKDDVSVAHQSSNRTIIVIDNVVKARRVEKPFSHVTIDGSNYQIGATSSTPVITSSFSLKRVIPKISRPPESVTPVSRVSNELQKSVVSLGTSSSKVVETTKSVASVSSVPHELQQSNFSLSNSSSEIVERPKSLARVSLVPNELQQSRFSLDNASSEVTKTPKSVVPHIPDMMTSDCTQMRLIRKTQQMKKKYEERLKIMNHVSKQLRKRKAFLENLLIRIKEKQLTSDDDIIDLMDCFVGEEEEEEETMSSDEDSSTNAEEYKNNIAFIDSKISKFKKSIKDRNDSSSAKECEAFGLHLESVLKEMSTEKATSVKSQIVEVLKGYQGKKLLKMYQDFNKTFAGLENIEVNESE